MMFNARGELYVCEGAAYRIVAYDVHTKAKRVLCSEIDGQHFNEPNDLAIDFRAASTSPTRTTSTTASRP